MANTIQVVPDRVQVVDWLAPHLEAHPDEALAAWKAYRFGRKVFLGIERALHEGRVFFPDAGRQVPKNLPCPRSRILFLGLGGEEFDEHRDGQTGNECTATLMLDRLKLHHDAALVKMARWTLANDQKGAGVAFDWADIMKAAFHAGLSNGTVLRRSFRVFDAVYNVLSGQARYTDITGMRGYWQLAADFILGLTKNEYLGNPDYYFDGPLKAARATGLAGDESIAWILKYERDIKGLEGQPPREPGFMEIPSIVQALYRDGASVGEVTQLVDEMHNSRLVEQKLFLEAVDQWAAVMSAHRQNKRHSDGRLYSIEEAGVTYKVAVIFSENRRIVSAIRSSTAKPHVIVRVMPKTMHISLFARGMDVTPIVARLRAACWAAVGNTSILSPERLNHEWTIDEVPHLCFQKKAGNILNSSLTAPNVPKLTIGLKRYMECVAEGLREVARAAAQHRKATKQRQRQQRARMTP